MNSVKKLLAVLLALCMVCSLCACGGTIEEPEATPETSPAAPSPQETAEPTPKPGEDDTGLTVYTITVVDDSGTPVSGAMVQMCKDTCLPGPATDAEGKTCFNLLEDEYKVSFIVVPAGYNYIDEVTEFYFEDGATELTITLKKDA